MWPASFQSVKKNPPLNDFAVVNSSEIGDIVDTYRLRRSTRCILPIARFNELNEVLKPLRQLQCVPVRVVLYRHWTTVFSVPERIFSFYRTASARCAPLSRRFDELCKSEEEYSTLFSLTVALTHCSVTFIALMPSCD